MSNQANWALVISGYTTVFAILLGFVVYLFKHGVQKIVNELIDEKILPQLSQLSNNGGKSVKDVVDKTFAIVQTLVTTDANHEARLQTLERNELQRGQH